jgi:hypothetical protein
MAVCFLEQALCRSQHPEITIHCAQTHWRPLDEQVPGVWIEEFIQVERRLRLA